MSPKLLPPPLERGADLQCIVRVPNKLSPLALLHSTHHSKSHGVLCSGTASGELHFWDASSGAFIFGVAARHPHNAGLTAMSTNEGYLEGGGGDGVKVDASEGHIGAVGASGGGATTTTAAVGGAPAVASGSADLMLYTACEEGFVKTWKVGERSKNGCLCRGDRKTVGKCRTVR